ncbi:MAG: signal recognition particle-docking protein FtsY [Victivallales bacterium]|nr:signal recognition particle-docking protein FtsY [Victivallales bacterium]MCF7889092.1 signal recognition particle-docking protein FtsY [Victivallales bacterium]
MKKKSIFNLFHNGLRKTAVSLSRKVGSCFSENKLWNEETYEELEAGLISADFGINSTLKITESIREKYNNGKISSNEDIIDVAKEQLLSIIGEKKIPNFSQDELSVILLVGVNGSGKTTTAGKLAFKYKKQGHKVMLAACDTFRAAAAEQLKIWGKKTDTYVVSSKYGADPSAVAFDAVKSALSRNCDFLILDTAGRQHNRENLMEELAKMKRSISKAYPSAPHETWLVIDGNVGSNALMQAKEFSKVTDVSGLICTKLDGTGKGGMVVAVKDEFDIPVYYIGLGEKPEELQEFNPELFTDALFEDLA